MWRDSVPTLPVSGSASVGSLTQATDVDTLDDTSQESLAAAPAWAVDTDLIFTPGTNKLTLTQQRPLIRFVIQDAFEYLRASLLFTHAFPDAGVYPARIRAALVAGAKCHYPKSSEILHRLMCDDEYLAIMSRLVSLLI
jgi:hypothetical protein